MFKSTCSVWSVNIPGFFYFFVVVVLILVVFHLLRSFTISICEYICRLSGLASIASICPLSNHCSDLTSYLVLLPTHPWNLSLVVTLSNRLLWYNLSHPSHTPPRTHWRAYLSQYWSVCDYHYLVNIHHTHWSINSTRAKTRSIYLPILSLASSTIAVQKVFVQ